MYAIPSDESPLVWTLTVGREPGVRRRPSVRVEAATPPGTRRAPQLLRVLAGGATLLWGRRDDPWDTHCRFVRGALPAHTSALPAVTLADHRACRHTAHSEGWWTHWLRYFADALAASTDGVLLHMPTTLLARSPFGSFLWPGLLLFTLVGLLKTVAAWQHRWRAPYAGFWSLAAGSSLSLWIATEMLMLHSAHWLQVGYLGLGVATVVVSAAHIRRLMAEFASVRSSPTT